jgi:aryl-alcohol dehydrogenase (NADP+)
MKFNKLGISNLKVSQICLGTMTFGNPVNKIEAIKLIHWALNNGINYIDTADIYEGYDRHATSAGGVAEKFIGYALKGRRDKVILTTKVGNSIGGGYIGSGLGPKHIEHQINRSLQFLNTDYIDVYQMHKPDPLTPLEESISAFMNLIKLGKIRYWGVSNFNTDEMSNLLNICKKNDWQLPIVSQSTYSWLNRALESEFIPLLERNKIALNPYRILEGGLLSSKYKKGIIAKKDSRLNLHPNWMSPLDDTVYKSIEKFEKEAIQFGLSPVQYAAKWLLNQSGIPSVLVGAKRLDQIEPFLNI